MFDILSWTCLVRKLLYPTSVAVWNVELGKVSDCENIDNLDEKFQRLHGTIYEKKGLPLPSSSSLYNTMRGSKASVVSIAV